MNDLKIFTENVEPVALNQIYTLISQPSFSNEKVRIMPDVHAGAGCVVGFTSTMSDKVIPNLIGVDIGCGMLTCELGQFEINLKDLDDFIKAKIPSGSEYLREVDGEHLIDSLLCKNQLRNLDRLYGSLGTLGGGNHFIEVDVDDDGNKYLIVHSGSRNLGMQVAKIYQNLAVESCKNASKQEREELIAQLKDQDRTADIADELKKLTEKYAHKTKIPNELCYLDGENMQAYLHDMRICQQFAKQNREKMVKKMLSFIGAFKYSQFETVHNFIDNNNVIRKGAVPAHKGQKILIPMNMRDGCLICEGLGNEDWNCSAPHGAGRLFSRSEAKNLISLEEYKQSMKGIYTTTATMATIDEAPMAYKPMDEIVKLISPTCKILKIIKPIYNFKAAE
ncbi:MAG: RtcB family protein [Clostridia bacterium]|nr:RtcB family protein [Clostridia bacterium]